ncbi:fimbria/pilus outer membrane usher protein [Escherichia coli]
MGNGKLSQPLRRHLDAIFHARLGNIYLTFSRQEYWQTDEVERLLQFGYNNNWRNISWNVSWELYGLDQELIQQPS